MTSSPRCTSKVALLAYDRLCTFEFGIMVELFGIARPEFDSWYELHVCAQERGAIRAAGGITVQAQRTLRMLDHAGTIIIPGWREPHADVPDLLVRKLVRAHSEGARILSVCSGAFVLAEAGLLDDKKATTHWRYAEALQASYPRVRVDSNVLYTEEDNVFTSAGSAAGMDLGLHLIRQDHGAEVANQVARRLVVSPHRDGGQQQFIEQPMTAPAELPFSRHLDEIRGRLAEPHTIESMAGEAHMSPRTYARHFKAATGTTPHRWLVQERVQLAQQLLEVTEDPLEYVANCVGFSEAQLLRHHFRRIVGVSPLAYRRQFRGAQESS